MNDKLISIIVFSYFSEKRLDNACARVIETFEKEQIPFELIIMDDGSKDNSWQIAEKLEASDERISAYALSKNYTTPYAQFAGLSVCKGACAVFVPDDLQRPLEVVVKMYRIWEQGNKIVVGYKKTRDDGKMNDLFSNTYYKIMNLFSDITFPPGGADGFLADREIIDILNERIRPRNTSTMVEVLRLGFDPVFIPYDRPKREGKSRWTMKKKIRLAKDTFLASSSFPIKLITRLGFSIFFLSFLMIFILIYAKLFTDNRLFGLPIVGWATTLSIIMFFNGLTLLCFGIIAEYIWRIFEEVKERPGYIIKRKGRDRRKN